MKELKEIVKAYTSAVEKGMQCALLSVVCVEGSAYRQPGARMLVTSDGILSGAISGGCLEGDALRKAQLAMFRNQKMLVRYDTNGEDDSTIGVNMGCNGIIDILIEPIDTQDPGNPVELIKQAIAAESGCVLVSIYDENRRGIHRGTCIQLSEDRNNPPELYQYSFLEDEIRNVLSARQSRVMKLDDNFAFMQFVQPSPVVHIFGGGNDTIAVHNLAAMLGWDINIIDGRPGYATRQRFPAAKNVLFARASEAISQLTINKDSVVLLMTHNYSYDLSVIKGVIPFDPAYIGVLGPRKKLLRMMEELEESGVRMDGIKHSVYGPAGIDIGAESPDEIALSIISEIKAVLSARKAGFLKDKITPIHKVSLTQPA